MILLSERTENAQERHSERFTGRVDEKDYPAGTIEIRVVFWRFDIMAGRWSGSKHSQKYEPSKNILAWTNRVLVNI